MVLMVQKKWRRGLREETSLPAEEAGESLLSISVKAYGRPEIIRKVPADIFSGAKGGFGSAKNFRNLQRIFPRHQREKIFEIAKRFFPKRKMLINNLKAQKDDFMACNIDEKRERKTCLWNNGMSMSRRDLDMRECEPIFNKIFEFFKIPQSIRENVFYLE